jgi:hypothetical protein
VIGVKVWYHVIAAVVGLAVAALIVYIVFGNASQQGAVQDGTAPGSLDQGAGGAMCGSIAPSAGTSAAARKTASANQPSLFTKSGAISSLKPKDQRDWVNRVHAAAGLCTDEIHIVQGRTTLAISASSKVSAADISAYTAGALAQAFTAPFNPLGCGACHVEVTTTVKGADRSALVSTRAWAAFQFARKSRHLPLTMHALQQFQAASSYRAGDLAVHGW